MALRAATAAILLACLAAVASASRDLHQKAEKTPVFATWADGIKAAGGPTSQISTFIAAVKAAGVADALTPKTKWTILAPTNAAFDALKAATGLAPADLLKPENKDLLVKVLSLHVIPAGAVGSADLTSGQKVATALKGASPLSVKLGDKKVEFVGPANTAAVVLPDIKVGSSVIHVIDTVLLPAGVGKKAAAAGRR